MEEEREEEEEEGQDDDYCYDVGIVGFGPAGALLSILLQKKGYSMIIFDSRKTPYPLPRAAALDDEVVRILDAVSETQPETRKKQFFNQPDSVLITNAQLCSSETGKVLWTLNSEWRRLNKGHTLNFIHQPWVETRLRQILQNNIQHDDLHKTKRNNSNNNNQQKVTFKLGYKVIDIIQKHDNYEIKTNNHKLYKVNNIFGSDGTNSIVKRLFLTNPKSNKQNNNNNALQTTTIIQNLLYKSLYKPLYNMILNKIISISICSWYVIDTIQPHKTSSTSSTTTTTTTTTIPPLPFKFYLTPKPGCEMPLACHHYRYESPSPPPFPSPPFSPLPSTSQTIRSTQYQFGFNISSSFYYSGDKGAAEGVGGVWGVGDSIHVIPPFAGQGLCHALRDSFNLFWKFHLHYSLSRSTQTNGKTINNHLIMSYEKERKKSVKDSGIRSGVLGCVIVGKWGGYCGRKVRDVGLRIGMQFKSVREYISKNDIFRPLPHYSSSSSFIDHHLTNNNKKYKNIIGGMCERWIDELIVGKNYTFHFSVIIFSSSLVNSSEKNNDDNLTELYRYYNQLFHLNHDDKDDENTNKDVVRFWNEVGITFYFVLPSSYQDWYHQNIQNYKLMNNTTNNDHINNRLINKNKKNNIKLKWILDNKEKEIENYFKQHQLQYLFIRPDFYIHSCSHDLNDLNSILHQLFVSFYSSNNDNDDNVNRSNDSKNKPNAYAIINYFHSYWIHLVILLFLFFLLGNYLV